MRLFLQRKTCEEWKKVLIHLDIEYIIILSCPLFAFISGPFLHFSNYLNDQVYEASDVVCCIVITLITLYFFSLTMALMDYMIKFVFDDIGAIRNTPPGDKPPELMADRPIHKGFLLFSCFLLFNITCLLSSALSKWLFLVLF